MKTYYIIEKDERLTMSADPSDMKVYKTSNNGQFTTGYLTMTSLVSAKKIAKSCGMDVVIYIGSETQNDERVYVS